MDRDSSFRFYEFFAGGGLARLGLGKDWRCLFANDIDAMKCEAYRANFGGGDLYQGDVWDLSAEHLPGEADLAWASFPCQDLSLAGKRAGLHGARSGTFFGFWTLMTQLRAAGRAPHILAIENVSGAMTSNGGADFAALIAELTGQGWRAGALELDAAHFVPQSRPRLFVIAARDARGGLERFIDHDADGSDSAFGRTTAVRAAYARLPDELKDRWAWWRLPEPPARKTTLGDVIEADIGPWRSEAETERLISLMSPRHREKLEAARSAPERKIGAAYRRMRIESGERVQRAELRFDGLAGCLRTPAGGSSRQFVIVCENGEVRVRSLNPREAARLMGAPDSYVLPDSATAALSVMGDGLAVPVVRHLAACLLEPMAEQLRARSRPPAMAAAE